MKAVYSFYSAPYAGNPTTNPGNWSRPGVEFLVWAWSVLQTRKWASRVELVTDRIGARLFDELGIEFDTVTVALDDVEPAGGRLWAMGKIAAYSLQEEPFVHLDGDAWFASPPGSHVLAHRVACQSREHSGIGSSYFRLLRKVLQTTNNDDPYRLFHAIGARMPIAGCLAVYSCNDLEFNRRYCAEARAFYDAYLAPCKGNFRTFYDWNIFVEQLIFGEVCYQTRGCEPVYLIPTEKLASPTNDLDYCHVWGAKRSRSLRLQSLGRLASEHPAVFRRIAGRFGLERKLDKELALA